MWGVMMSDLIRQDLINKVCTEFELDPIRLVRTERFRWILEERSGIGLEMIKIERRLQELTDHPIDLRLQPSKDKNKRFDRNYLRGVEKL